MSEALTALAVGAVLALGQLLREAMDRRKRHSGARRTRADDR